MLTLLLLALCLGAGGFAFLHSPGFYIEAVEVLGNQRVSAEEIVGRSGLVPGVHLLAALDDAIVRSILENPWLERVKVRPAYPGRVVITVQEREPAAVLATPDGFWVVDAGGFLLAQQKAPTAALVIITGIPEGGWATRSRPPAADLVMALQVVSALAMRPLRPPAQEVAVTGGEVELFLTGGIRVLMGRPGAQLGQTLNVLAAVLAAQGGELAQISVIDLRFGRPVIR
jgi:cell division protein FtsQ